MSDPRTVLAYAGVSALGLCVGSFLNVVAYRLPRECMSVAGPRSRCPRCARFIAWYDNLPVLSWLLLRARCRHCGKGIPARYPLVEAGTAALFVATAAWTLPRAAFADPLAHGAEWGVAGARFLVTAALIALALIDYDWEILPDQITLGGLALAPILVFAAPSLQPTSVIDDWTIGGRVVGEVLGPRWTAVVHGLLGAAACGGFLWTVGFLGSLAFRKEAMGLGDVKMCAAMGALLGFWSLAALLVAVFSATLIGVPLKMLGRGSYIRFGPFLALGAWTTMNDGERVLDVWAALTRAAAR